MTREPLVILAPRVTDDSVTIWRTCLALGWEVMRLQGWKIPEHLADDPRPVILYGEPLFAEAAADQLLLVLLEPSIDWLVHLPQEYTQRKIELLTLDEARASDVPAFVKPADGKIFEPKVYASGQDLPGGDQVDGSIKVLRSGIMDFRLEVRCFVHQRRVMTLSLYWREGDLAQDAGGEWPFHPGEEEAARAFVSRILDDSRVPLPPGCTVDIARTSSGEWVIIEANPCWGAGLYGCDPEAVLKTICGTVIRRSEVTSALLPWISRRREDLHSL